MNLAIVEDHAALRASLVEVLASDGHHVMAFESAEVFLTDCSIASVDIVLLDLNLPGEDGVALARKLRTAFPEIGIIMLTARTSSEERRIGYLEGADIYLAKPSSADELTSAVTALGRRINPEAITQGPLMMDLRTMILNGPKANIPLSVSDAKLIKTFVDSPDQQLSTEAIAGAISANGILSRGAVGVKIVRLRKKLRLAGAEGNPINVVRKRGFQLCAYIRLSNE